MNKVKAFFNNKLNVITFIGVIVVILIVLFFVFFSDNNGVGSLFSEASDSVKFEDEYEDLNNKTVDGDKKYPKVKLPSNNLIKYSTIEEVLNIFNNKEDAVVYFGYSTCLYCRNAIQVLLDTAVDTELDELLYIDIEDYWDVKELDANNNIITTKEPHVKYYELLNVLGDELITDYVLLNSNGEEVKTGDKRIQYPLVIFIADGSVVSYNIGTLFSQDDPFVEMDDSQVEGLSKIYRYGIMDVVDSKKNKGLLK